MLCVVDEPEGIYYGSTVCAPIVQEFLSNVLPYLGIEPQYTKEETGGVIPAPSVTGCSYAEARRIAREAGLELRSLGTGVSVTEQYPAAGENINAGTQLIVYLGGGEEETP